MIETIKSLQYSFAGLILLSCIGSAARAADIAAPVVLVATERLAGSPYEQTVLLAVPSGDGQHLGLIINRPTAIELAAIYPDSASSQSIFDPLFFGGPAMSGALFAAVRAADPPSEYSIPLMPGLFLVTDQDTVVRLIETTPNTARYFVGFVAWGATELGAEIRSGMWHMRPAEVSVLFRANPQQLWLEFVRSKGLVAAN